MFTSNQDPDSASLTWTTGGRESNLLLIPAEAPFLIGRSTAASVQLESGRVSRSHAEVRWDGGRWVLRDLGSRNGTRIGKRSIRGEAVVLGDSEVLRCGDVALVFTSHARDRRTSQSTTIDDEAQPILTAGDVALLRELCGPSDFADPASTSNRRPTNAELAGRLHLTEDGVRKRLNRLYAKFGLEGSSPSKRYELVKLAQASGALDRHS